MPDLADWLIPFRPRLARRVALTMAAITVAVAAWLASFPPVPLTDGDRIGIFLVALLIVWMCWRQAGVRAVPTDQGLTVRNIIRTTALEWAQIVNVTYGDSSPWAILDISNGSTLAVMAIQRADGPFGTAEAKRLATLVAAYSPREP